jgi:hypothetical protein
MAMLRRLAKPSQLAQPASSHFREVRVPRKEPRRADPETTALKAVAFIVSDQDLASRFLALTGLGPDELRAGLGDRGVLASVLGFLESHEPDLIACADILGVPPGTLVEARRQLEDDPRS